MNGYLRQIQKALAFIEEHLDEELRPEGIAPHAGISMWHFQRIFSGALGQPVMDYLRRRRLSWAMDRLCSKSATIHDIALDSGFRSQEAFRAPLETRFRLPSQCP